MPVQTWTPGQILTSAEIGTVTNMLPYYVPLSLSTNTQAVSPVAGTLTGITCGAYTGCVVTLPTATLGAVVGVAKIDATAPTLAVYGGAGGALILGPGFGAGEAYAYLGSVGSYVILEADGTNWHVIGGAQDTGWLPIPTYTNSWVSNSGPATGGTVAGYRKVGNTVYLGGTVKSGTMATAAFTLPAYVSGTSSNSRPSRAVSLIIWTVTSVPAAGLWSIATTGVNTAPSGGTGPVPYLDSLDFTVD